MKTYYPKNMYRVKKGNDHFIVKCNDQMILETMVHNDNIDEYSLLQVTSIDKPEEIQ